MSVPEPELRHELLRRCEIEQDARFAYYRAPEHERVSCWERIRVIDSDNLAFLIDVIGQRAWLGSDLVGMDGARACWLMVQHAPIEHQDHAATHGSVCEMGSDLSGEVVVAVGGWASSATVVRPDTLGELARAAGPARAASHPQRS